VIYFPFAFLSIFGLASGIYRILLKSTSMVFSKNLTNKIKQKNVHTWWK
jgi:hypothetical protein